MIPPIALQLKTSKEQLTALIKRESELTTAMPTLEGHARTNAQNDLLRQILITQLTSRLEQLHAAANAAQADKKEE